ncbi:sulfotransferase [Gemmatimonas sp.]
MSAAERRPDFLVIGGSRCGTTSLHAALARHAALFVPAEKSPNFFSAPDVDAVPDSAALRAMKGHAVTSTREYLRLFADAPADALIGEVSPVYLQSVHTAARAATFCPEARIVAMLRHPVHRAYAHWLGRRRDGLDPHASFETAIADDLADATSPAVAFNRYLAIGRYAHFLRPWFDAFPRERIHVVFFDDFARDPRSVVNEVCTFLGVPPIAGHIPMEQKNQGGLIKQRWLRAAWTSTALWRASLRRHLPVTVRDAVGRAVLRNLERPRLDPVLANRLLGYFREDLDLLAMLLERPLPPWQEAVPPSRGATPDTVA